MIAKGPPTKSPTTFSPTTPSEPEDIKVWDYAFWFLRIVNAHFALTDFCGHYPYARRVEGQ